MLQARLRFLWGEGSKHKGKASVYVSCIATVCCPASAALCQTSELELRFVNLGSALISYL